MKKLSDKELQDWLDGQLALEKNEYDATSSKELELFEEVLNELKSEELHPGPTYAFAEKVTRTAFLAAEAKKDRKQTFVIGTIVALTLVFGAFVLAYYNVSIQRIVGNHSPAQVLLLAFFAVSTFVAIQVADKKLVQKQ